MNAIEMADDEQKNLKFASGYQIVILLMWAVWTGGGEDSWSFITWVELFACAPHDPIQFAYTTHPEARTIYALREQYKFSTPNRIRIEIRRTRSTRIKG